MKGNDLRPNHTFLSSPQSKLFFFSPHKKSRWQQTSKPSLSHFHVLDFWRNGQNELKTTNIHRAVDRQATKFFDCLVFTVCWGTHHFKKNIIVTGRHKSRPIKYIFDLNVKRVPFNSYYKYLSTCKQAHLQCASYMFEYINRFISMYAFLMMCANHLNLTCVQVCFGFFPLLLLFLAKVCKNHSEAGVWITASKHAGDRDRREATPVPCHHPKTELLQNILKCLTDLDTEF